MCGNIILSGICANNFSPWGFYLKNESSSGSSSGSIYDSNSTSDPNLNPNLNPKLNPNINTNLNPNVNPNHNPNISPEVLIRSCNKCNCLRPLTDESKYTCRSCNTANVNCPYCASVVIYDGIWAHVKKQHPDVDIPKGFSRNPLSRFPHLSEKTINHSWQSKTVSPLVISQTQESCLCKYYNFVSFRINNGLNIEKVKENINRVYII